MNLNYNFNNKKATCSCVAYGQHFFRCLNKFIFKWWFKYSKEEEYVLDIEVKTTKEYLCRIVHKKFYDCKQFHIVIAYFHKSYVSNGSIIEFWIFLYSFTLKHEKKKLYIKYPSVLWSRLTPFSSYYTPPKWVHFICFIEYIFYIFHLLTHLRCGNVCSLLEICTNYQHYCLELSERMYNTYLWHNSYNHTSSLFFLLQITSTCPGFVEPKFKNNFIVWTYIWWYVMCVQCLCIENIVTTRIYTPLFVTSMIIFFIITICLLV